MPYEQKGTELGRLVNQKQKAYGNSVEQTYELMKIYLKKYNNGDGTYTFPESLLKEILLQTRVIDKQNRIFNNPDGDLMDENPWRDIGGYALLGEEMGREYGKKKPRKMTPTEEVTKAVRNSSPYDTSYE